MCHLFRKGWFFIGVVKHFIYEDSGTYFVRWSSIIHVIIFLHLFNYIFWTLWVFWWFLDLIKHRGFFFYREKTIPNTFVIKLWALVKSTCLNAIIIPNYTALVPVVIHKLSCDQWTYKRGISRVVLLFDLVYSRDVTGRPVFHLWANQIHFLVVIKSGVTQASF